MWDPPVRTVAVSAHWFARAYIILVIVCMVCVQANSVRRRREARRRGATAVWGTVCVRPSSSHCCGEWELVCACVYRISDRVYGVCAGKQCDAAKVGPEERRDCCVGDGVRATLQFALLR